MNELDLAALKHDMRHMYKHIGPMGAFQVLYEMLVSVQVLSEVILEELTKGTTEDKPDEKK